MLLYKKILDIVQFVKKSLFKDFEEVQDLTPVKTIGENILLYYQILRHYFCIKTIVDFIFDIVDVLEFIVNSKQNKDRYSS